MKNNKGFVLTEVLILSTVVIGLLVFMYVQFKGINRSYQLGFKYDTVGGMYLANNIINYINEDAYDSLVAGLNSSQKKYIDITDCDVNYFSSSSYCDNLINKSKIEQIIFVKEDLNELKKNMNDFSDDFRDYVNSIKISNAFNDYRIIVKYDDDTYATMRFNKGSYLAIPGEIMQDGRKYYDTLWVKANPIYFNPITGDKCDNYHSDNSNTGYNGISTNGNVSGNTSNNNGCLKWYAYSENSDGTVNMILDHNTGDGIQWYTFDDNSRKAETALTKLIYGTAENPSDTAGWIGVPTRSDIYEAKWNNGTDNVTSIINYSGYKARVITAQEIANITGAAKTTTDGGIGWNENLATYNDRVRFGTYDMIDYVDMDDNQKQQQQLYSWLFDNLNDCVSFGCTTFQNNSGNYGYWTSSPVTNENNVVWLVRATGALVNDGPSKVPYGVRPVITIPGYIIVK